MAVHRKFVLFRNKLREMIYPGVTKRVVIMLWCFAVSVFLYFFSILLESEISFSNFATFSMLLFGGGVAYHVFTELISCPQTDENYEAWLPVFWRLIKLCVSYVVVGLSLFLGHKLGGSWGLLLGLLALIFGCIWAWFCLVALEKPIKTLLATDAAPLSGKQYLTDDQGNRTAVVLDIEEYERMLDELEELDDIRAYDEAKASGEERLPLEQAIIKVEREHS